MVNNAIHVLVIAPPGPWRESLRILLQASRRAATLEWAADVPSGWRLSIRKRPNLVLLDANLVRSTVEEALLIFNLPGTSCPCLVLTHSPSQEQSARAAGASLILTDGFSTEVFFDALDRVIRER